ncbi:hypothetical protein B0J13DRAFT_553639 [Dactylonectria estremocensis]|uniref:Uncharacterized protein n=1 Tax=Dactylonectria estremocensis TaxID=1079267 RepID=A0A9P9EVZ3_9HYPO|nr:hypothetical protein B0J13DRAFT_553639 [Dactylonectria estremocensis]
MADYDGQYYEYKVYVTIPDLTRDAVIQALCGDGDEEVDKVTVEILNGQTTQEVIQHHRGSTPRGGNEHPKLFLVFDTADLEGRGVLLVSLDEYHGYSDALRFSVVEARDNINSLCVGNDGWFTFRENIPDAKTDAVPVNWFALYNLLPEEKEDDFRTALAKMNEGVQVIGISDDDGMEVDGNSNGDGSGSDGGSWEDGNASDDDASIGQPVPSDDEEEADDGDQEEAAADDDDDELPKYYKAARTESRDIQHIMDGHASYAQEDRLDPDRFAAVDEQYKKEGPLIVRVKPQRDSFRCKGEVAGEILRWIFINLMTWDEAKGFSSSSRG